MKITDDWAGPATSILSSLMQLLSYMSQFLNWIGHNIHQLQCSCCWLVISYYLWISHSSSDAPLLKAIALRCPRSACSLSRSLSISLWTVYAQVIQSSVISHIFSTSLEHECFRERLWHWKILANKQDDVWSDNHEDTRRGRPPAARPTFEYLEAE